MDLVKIFNFGNYQVKVNLSSLQIKNDKYIFQFGKGGDFQNYGIIEISTTDFALSTDCFSGQRIYYWQELDTIYITDSVDKFMPLSELDILERNEEETNLFNKHGYTSGNATQYHKIKKVPPASKLIVSQNGVTLKSIWRMSAIKNTPDKEKFEMAIHNAVKDALIPVQGTDRPIVLCFSGGKDSTYLGMVLKEMGIPHDLVFFRDKTKRINNIEIEKAERQAKKLGKKLNIIDIPIKDDNIVENEIKKFNLFDKHYCRYHFYGLSVLKKKYGADVIIINGQNADSILSFGPSESKFSSYIKRYLMYGKNRMFKKSFSYIIGHMFGEKLKIPLTDDEYLEAFYDNFKYCVLLDERSDSYKNYIRKQIESIRNFIQGSETKNNLLMYLKLYTHSQASDAQVVTQSAKLYKLDLIMPLSGEKIIEATLRYKDDNKELYHPKYALDSICRNL